MILVIYSFIYCGRVIIKKYFMKIGLTFFLFLISIVASGQKFDRPTEEFFITGQVKKELKFTLNDLGKFPSKNINEVVITNHLGEQRSTARELKGVLIKDLFWKIELQEDSPKRFSEFYFVFVAADNYKVVYSWNEIFNSPIGDSLYLITSKDGKLDQEMEERMLVITPIDYKTGRRYIKGLSKVLVRRAE